jgi:TPP-dependent pyruvate/acetoin dehydrogenase alpha subunit
LKPHLFNINIDEEAMSTDIWSLYEMMYKSRLFEEAVARLWQEGMISGEMHLGTGEEAIAAGVVTHLREGDALALDHRSTPVLLMRGVDPVQILLELFGHPKGLCGGKGGHMHLFSKEYLAASTGIVGAGGPAATGFGLAAQMLRRETISVAFFGEGAMNQGMLMESLHLASLWKLPVLFVCKDDGWQITTRSDELTEHNLLRKAETLGVQGMDIDGTDVRAMSDAAGDAIGRLRAGAGPIFLHARCVHLEGHFLGFQLLRAVREPIKEMSKIAGPILKAFIHPAGSILKERLAGIGVITDAMLSTKRDPRRNVAADPLRRSRALLQPERGRLKELEERVEAELEAILASALAEVQP